MSEGEKLEEIGKAMMQAWRRIKSAQARMWGDWMTIGEGLLEGRRWAMKQAGTNRPEGKGYVTAYAEWLKRYRVDDMDKSDRAKLLQLMEERPGVEEWRATLSDYDRRNLNNPTIAWRKWTAATRVKKPKPRTAGVSPTEHGRARATIEQLQARTDELEQELAAAHAELETAREATGEDGTGAAREVLLDAIDRVMTLGAQETAWPPTSGRKAKQRKKLLDEIRYRLIDLRGLAQPEQANAGVRADHDADTEDAI